MTESVEKNILRLVFRICEMTVWHQDYLTNFISKDEIIPSICAKKLIIEFYGFMATIKVMD